MVLADAIALPTSLFVAAWLVRPELFGVIGIWIWLIPLVAGLSGLALSGFYRSVVRFMGFELLAAAFVLVLGMILFAGIWAGGMLSALD